MIKTFVFMGLPGSGKGKQAELLHARTNFQIFSTGEECRKIAEIDSPVGKKVKDIINSGNLVPPWLASFLFEKALLGLKESDGAIFEGVGREEPEARLFDEVCSWLERDYRIIHLKVSEESVLERLRQRQLTEGRSDDAPEIYRNRFENFYAYTVPAIRYFTSRGKVIEIDGEPPPDIVAGLVWEKVAPLL